MDGLRDELELVTEKNRELERRLQIAATERDHMASALEEASDRILLLERHAREQDLRYQQSIKEYSLPQEKITIEERLSGESNICPLMSTRLFLTNRSPLKLIFQSACFLTLI